MRTTLGAIVTLLLTLALAATASAQDNCKSFDPGHGATPFTFGMKKPDLGKFGYEVKPGFTDGVFEVGPYTIWLDATGVTTIAVDASALPCLVPAGAKSKKAPRIDASKARMEELATFFGGCGLLQMNTGANVIDCANGITILQSMAGIELRTSKEARPVETPCDAYVTPGATDATTKAVDVKPGKVYCVGTRTLTADVSPADITALDGKLRYNTCPRTDNRGGTTVQCDYDGVRFLFAGPKQALHRIEAIPTKP